MTVKKECDCESEYQDETHGKKIRIHNIGIKTVKCTVCGKVKT